MGSLGVWGCGGSGVWVVWMVAHTSFRAERQACAHTSWEVCICVRIDACSVRMKAISIHVCCCTVFSSELHLNACSCDILNTNTHTRTHARAHTVLPGILAVPLCCVAVQQIGTCCYWHLPSSADSSAWPPIIMLE